MTQREQHGEGPRTQPFPGPMGPTVPPPAPGNRGGPPQRRRGTGDAPRQEPTREPEGVYVISVAARLLAMHPQTLRKYERIGLVKPSRTGGMLRLYSAEDIIQLRMIKHLVDDIHLNLAGVELVMSMVQRLMASRRQISPSPDETWRRMEREVAGLLAMLMDQS